MDWKAHLFLGAVSGGLLAHLFFGFDGIELASYSALSGMCALLPDLDARKSKASSALFWLAMAVAAFLAAAGFPWWQPAAIAMALLAFDFALRPRHRGIMHSAAFLAAASILAYFFFGLVAASAFSIGYLSHLLADFCLKI
ncbi:MAG: metal-dependent hydrolase [Candidatus Micrarchaeota archaeon]|nr:metal-dependent hydrolase [Candidatus Micrarchaeota archaeon]